MLPKYLLIQGVLILILAIWLLSFHLTNQTQENTILELRRLNTDCRKKLEATKFNIPSKCSEEDK